MYAALVARRFEELRRSTWLLIVKRSGLLTFLVLAIGLLSLAVGWRAHRQGQFARLKTELKVKRDSAPEVSATARPGGQEAIVLQRAQPTVGTVPEFLSATVLPGRGMNVLQITAYLPHKGEVQLLASPSLDEAARLMDGNGTDLAGEASLAMGGAFEVPWASRIFGAVPPGGTSIVTAWNGQPLKLPQTAMKYAGDAVSVGGLLLRRGADSVKTSVMPDGGEAQATFNAGDFYGHWISQTEITTSVQLSGRAMELQVVARNTGDKPEPMGVGWHPRFAILSGDRERATLRMPSAERAEVRDRSSGLPSGKLLPVAGTEYDFTARAGVPLGQRSLDDSFVHLRPTLLESGPVAELRDPESGYGLRITAITPTIKAMRVYAPADAKFVSIAPQFNYDDPFGHEWPKEEDTGMVVLQPGQSTQWTVRLEIFPLTPDESKR
jgi:aldose 1-epimerase